MERLMKAVCPICGLEVDYLDIHVRADEAMLEILKARHPECETADGIHPERLGKLRQCTEEGLSCDFFAGNNRPRQKSEERTSSEASVIYCSSPLKAGTFTLPIQF